MPSSVCSSLLAFGAVLTAVSAPAGAIVAGIGVIYECTLFVMAGMER